MSSVFALKKRFKSKRGTSLVESVVSILILSIVVIAVVQTMSITRLTTLKHSVQTSEMSNAELILNRLIPAIPPELDMTKTPPEFKPLKTTAELEKICGAKYNSDENFVCTNTQNKFFTYEADKGTGGELYGYKITVGVFGADKKTLTLVSGYASAYSATFLPK